MNAFSRLNRDFFIRNTENVAKDLLGRYIVRETKDGVIVGKIIEVEAYMGPSDKACHCYDFKKTEKTNAMYLKPGSIYVYYIYGIYFCLNVITEPEGLPCAVFIRQLYPIEGIELMKQNRCTKIGRNYRNLVDGPSKLCMAFNITKDLFNGTDSCKIGSKLFFTEGEAIDPEKITIGKRIGIEYAQEDKDRLLRFTLS